MNWSAGSRTLHRSAGVHPMATLPAPTVILHPPGVDGHSLEVHPVVWGVDIHLGLGVQGDSLRAKRL